MYSRSDFRIPRPGKLPESLRPLVKYDFHKLDMDSQFSRSICMHSIQFDIMSDRKKEQVGDGKTEWGSVGVAVQAMNDTNPSEVDRQIEIVKGFQVIATTLDGERQLYEVRWLISLRQEATCRRELTRRRVPLLIHGLA